MESNYSMMQYQTSFLIDNIPPPKATKKLKALIWSWISHKETFDFNKRKRVEDFNDNLRYEPFQKESFHNQTKGWEKFCLGQFRPINVWGSGEGCRIHTSLCYKDDHVFWGMRYYEAETNFDVLTDIGINQGLKKTVFSIKVSFRPKNAKERFLPTLPRIIKDIWCDEIRFDIHSEGAPYSYFNRPKSLLSHRV